MFGTFRHILALFVVMHHLPPAYPPGRYAVFAFYLLSGYLMTLVIKETYGYSRSGIYRYLSNRFLRIYPAYYVMLALGLIFTVYLPELSRAVGEPIVFPHSTENFLVQISIFGLNGNSPPMIIPVAWSLEVEIFYYLVIFFLCSTRRLALLWFGLSLLGTAIAVISDVPWSLRYFSVAAASLPFSMGGVIYYYRENLLRLIRRPVVHVALGGGLFICNVAAAVMGAWGSLTGTLGFYLSLLLAGHLIIALTAVAPCVPKRLRKFDRVLGDLSYPIFLSHFNAGILVVAITGAQPKTWEFFFLSVPIIYLVSLGLNLSVDRFVQPLRNRLRPPLVTGAEGGVTVRQVV